MRVDNKPKIEAESLTFIYSRGMAFEKAALTDVTLSINSGEFVGLIGRTGSGKSTLAQLFCGLLSPTAGTVRIDGEDIFQNKKKMKLIHQKVGLVFQYPEHQLFESTVYKDVAFGPRNLGLTEEEVKIRVEQALELVGIPESIYEKSPFELSGGQKRRAAIAGVLSMQPEILILDEPTAGLDPVGKKEILSEIENLKSDITIILISHIMDDIARLSDKVIALDSGGAAAVGTPSEIFTNEELLHRIGLSLTKSSELLLKLKRKGLNVDIDRFTTGSAAREILRAAGKLR